MSLETGSSATDSTTQGLRREETARLGPQLIVKRTFLLRQRENRLEHLADRIDREAVSHERPALSLREIIGQDEFVWEAEQPEDLSPRLIGEGLEELVQAPMVVAEGPALGKDSLEIGWLLHGSISRGLCFPHRGREAQALCQLS